MDSRLHHGEGPPLSEVEKVLIIGSGGREHALAWALSNSPSKPEIIGLPGNPGLAELGRCVAGNPSDNELVLEVVRREGIDFTIVGPEQPLVGGLTDRLRAAGHDVFGPSRHAAALEGSKVFSKTLMRSHGIPTAAFEIFTKPQDAIAFLKRQSFPQVLKVDGLAAGKGVFVTKTIEEAKSVVERVLVQKEFGSAGNRLIVEECLKGEEMSLFVLTNGSDAVLLPTAQDYKRAEDKDAGPNTGGMGATAPVVSWSPALERRAMDEVILPTLEAMQGEGRPYTGLLYAGLMVDEGRPDVLEFNCRFGDPETQVVLPILKGDLLQALSWASGRDTQTPDLELSDQWAATVVLTSKGYPGSYAKGFPISGISKARELPGAFIFHAGTAWAEIGPTGRGESPFHPSPAPFGGAKSPEGSMNSNHRIVTTGGRVLNAVGRGDDLPSALRRAYEAASLVTFEGKTMRRDIGHRGIAALKEGKI
ncbi:MAG: phosphoribosylamine--glycine ligase [Candidatus Eisenbacteria bacterium]|uniref:Phosphoribosylamine--glycine ligase n=1 Tax=Eiseniibacteriota bacterium TaxID=2212470 RepID=A0A948RU18_UNCEI|nr:phosphoribosylamine--glycine ligase [Candidatus Eisenbacteria bacterium]MBU2690546.1 phosphoribosylamine--glycine ligase [Candidatus Eisenbacteria bacterium]